MKAIRKFLDFEISLLDFITIILLSGFSALILPFGFDYFVFFLVIIMILSIIRGKQLTPKGNSLNRLRKGIKQ